MNISRICFPCNQPTSIITPIKKTVRGINVKSACTIASRAQEKIQTTRTKLTIVLPIIYYLFHCQSVIPLVWQRLRKYQPVKLPNHICKWAIHLCTPWIRIQDTLQFKRKHLEDKKSVKYICRKKQVNTLMIRVMSHYVIFRWLVTWTQSDQWNQETKDF